MDTAQASRKQAVLLNLRQQVSELYTLFREEEQAKERKWNEEQPMLDAFISALAQTRELLRKEKKDITDQLSSLRSKWEKEAAKYKKSDRTELTDENVEVDDLQKKLIDLNNRELDVKFELEKLKQQFEGALKEDERQIYETKLVVLQDTRRILLEEINVLRGEIFRRETSIKYEAQCKAAETSGWEDLGRLEEQLARLDAKIDRAKQSLYFPAAKGYRFSGGSLGVYFAAKELYISELSGSFQIRSEPVQKPDGTWAVQLFVSLGGASNSQASAEPPVALARIHRRSCSFDVRHPEARQQSNSNTGSPLTRALSESSARNVCHQSTNKSLDGAPQEGSDDDAASVERTGAPSFPFPLPSPSPSHTPSGDDSSNGGHAYRAQYTNMMDTLGKNKERLKEVLNTTVSTPGKDSQDSSSGPTPPLTSTSSSPLAPHMKPPPLNLPKLPNQINPPDMGGTKGKLMGFAKKMSQSMVAKSQTLGEKVAARSQTLSQSLGERVVATSQSLSEKMAVQKQNLGERMAPVMARGQNLSEKMNHALSARGRGGGSVLQRRSVSSDNYQLLPGSGVAGVRGASEDVEQYSQGLPTQDVDLLDSPHRSTAGETGQHSGQCLVVTPEHGVSSTLPPGLAPEDTVSLSGRDDFSEVASSMDTYTEMPPAAAALGHINQRMVDPQLTTSLSGSRPLQDELFERGSASGLAISGVSDLSDALSTGGRSDDGFENIPLSVVDAVASPTAHSPMSHRNSPLAASNLSILPPLAVGAMKRASSEAGGTEGEPESERGDANEKGSIPAVWTEEIQPTNRRGVHVTLLSENMEVVGEKGSKMPNISTKELALEVEVMLQATFEYNGLMGWQAVETVVCEIVHLDRKVVGNNIPLPRQLIKTILNYLLPKTLTKSFLANLPVELGKYIMTSKDQLNFGGELRILGPSLPVFTVDLDAGASSTPEPAKPAPSIFTLGASVPPTPAQNAASLLQARRAQQLLGLTPAQAAGLTELFGSRSLAVLMAGQQALSVMELCRFYNLYHRSSAWHPLCNMINRALQAILDANGTPDKDFSFLGFMEQHVSKLVKNPVRINMAVQCLEFGIDVDAAVDTLRELFERLARDFYKNAQKSQKHTIMREPLEVQLENLHKWHQSTQALIRTFKLRFKSAAATVSASADKELFQINLNKLHYAGPLRLQMPLSMSPDASGHSFMVEVKLPSPQAAGNKSDLGKIVQIVRDLADTVLQGVGLADANSGIAGNEDMKAMVKDWQDRLVEAASPRTPRNRDDPSFMDLLEAPTLADPVLGRVFIRRLHAGLQLDEKRISELLAEGFVGRSNTNLVGGLLKCFGDLFSATVATQPLHEGAAEGEAPKVLLTLQSNDVTVVRADVDSLQLQSGISPKTATRLVQVLVMAIAHQFWKLSAKRVRLMNRMFQHVHEYLSKDVLDCFLCLSVSGQVHDNKIHVLVKGDPGSSQEAAQEQLSYPLHFVNDMNLGTIMESIKILVWDQS